MKRPHLIEYAEFDTSYSVGVVALDQQSKLEAFIQFDLMQVIDQVFDDIDRQAKTRDTVLRLDRLEIDLGRISYDDYRQQLPQRLRRELWRALDNARFTATTSKSVKNRTDSARSKEAELFYFLRHGYLPSLATIDRISDLESVLQKVIASAPASLLELIGVEERDDDILQRIKLQFSTATSANVMRLLEMSASKLDRTAEPSVMRDQLLFFLRQGYLQPSMAIASLDELESQLEQLIVSDAAVLLKSISSNNTILKKIETLFSAKAYASVKRLLESQPGLTRKKSASSATVNRIKSADELRLLLLAALKDDKRAGFQRAWQSLIVNEVELLKKVLYEIGQSAQNRRKLVDCLSPRQFRQLLQLLEPVAFNFLTMLLDHRQWLLTCLSQANADATLTENNLAEYLLGYLLVERAAHFNREACIESLLRQIESVAAVQSSSFWAAVTDALQKTTQQDDANSTQLASLIRAQIERLAAENNSSAILIENYNRYARVSDLFSQHESKSDETQLLSDIQFLQQHSPWLLQRLLRELQMAGDGWHGKLSTAILQKLVDVFLCLMNQSVASEAQTEPSELVRTIRRYAEHASGPQLYFADILQCLINDEVIDFEKIGIVENDLLTTVESTVRPVITALTVEQNNMLDTLSPMGMRAMSLMQAAEIITTASLATGLNLSPHQLQVIKCNLIKSYAHESGFLFNLQQFFRLYVETLLEQAGVSDAVQFYSLLGQALLQNSLAATRDITREMIEQLEDIAARSSVLPDKATEDIGTADERLDYTEVEQDIYITNAGLVLLAPWLPGLFQQLNFMENGKFLNDATAERAVHCLQFLINSSVASPEYLLVLNKLLCGCKPGKPIQRQIEITASETEQLESLLVAITQHWKALENTSVEGLRESFLQRNGRLQLRNNAWHLSVEARAYDMLLEQIPWSFSTIKFAWMERVIYVEWR